MASSTSSTSSPTNPVKRACDSCHRRKVKCIGEGTNPCKNCVSAGLACTYNAIPQKKGPKGSRAKVLSELRENQRNAQLAAGFPPDLGFDGRTLPTTFARTPGLLTTALIDSCIDYFFANVYPSLPIILRQRAQDTALGVDHSTEAYCMISALCAYVLIQANMTVPPNLLPRPEMAQMSNMSIGHILLEESVRVRKGFDYLEAPTQLSILTSFFYYSSYFGLGKDNTAWTYLREATTQAHLLGMHDEETYKNDPLDISRRRVLYWVLFATERAHSLHKHRPVSLHATIHPPSLDDMPTERPISTGLELLISLYKPIDDSFIGIWNKLHTHTNPTFLIQLQTQLTEALPGYLECTESQAVELRVTQHWLRIMIWQLCVSQGLVSSVAADSSLTFKYPLEVSRDLLAILGQFSQPAIEVHGMGLIEKLFDIACCLTDVAACVPFSPAQFTLEPREFVTRFLTLFAALRGGQTRYLHLFLTKISEVLPNLQLPRSLNLPQGFTSSAIGLSSRTLGTVPSNVHDDLSALPTSPSYPSSELIRQLAAQTGATLPFSTSQQPLLHIPSTRVDDMSLYDSSGAHGSAHSSGSASASQSATPGPFEPSPNSSRTQSSTHPIPASHAPHTHLPSHHVGVSPTAYDPRFATQGFPVDPSMMFKQDDTGGAGHLQAQDTLYAQGAHGAGRGGLGHGRGVGYSG